MAAVTMVESSAVTEVSNILVGDLLTLKHNTGSAICSVTSQTLAAGKN